MQPKEEQKMNYCKHCGSKLDPNQKFCKGCGNSIIETPPSVHNHINNDTSTIGYSQKQSGQVKSKKSWLIAPLIVICILSVLVWVFNKPIKGLYYTSKYKSESNIDKKFDYAALALKNLQNDSTYSNFKASLKEILNSDAYKAEEKLLELKDYIKEEDYNDFTVDLYNHKVLESVKKGDYHKAFANLVKVNSFGGDIRANEEYESIMDAIVNEISEENGSDSDGGKIMFDNLDSDPFDEIVEIVALNPNSSFDKYFQINLYKVQGNQYELSDCFTEEMPGFVFGELQNYSKKKKGLFLINVISSYISTGKVFSIKDGRFEGLGIVTSADSCEIVDFDNDGIFEIKTSNFDGSLDEYSHADVPRVLKYYKFTDGSTEPTMVKEKPLNFEY